MGQMAQSPLSALLVHSKAANVRPWQANQNSFSFRYIKSQHRKTRLIKFQHFEIRGFYRVTAHSCALPQIDAALYLRDIGQ